MASAQDAGVVAPDVDVAPVLNEKKNPAPASDADGVAQPEEPRFMVLEYRVEGSTKLDPAVIQRAVYPHLGPGRTFADIEAARAGVEKAYQAVGYKANVDIPEQRVQSGIVVLRVTEGKLEHLRIKGSRYFSLTRIRDQLPALRPGAVVHMPELQDQIANLNIASSDRQVTPVFRAGSVPGTVVVELHVKDESPLHAALEVNNRYTANTTHGRLNVSLRYDNLWQLEHSLSLSYQTAPEDPDQVTAYGATYVTRDAAGVWALYGVSTNSTLGGVGGVVSSTVGEGLIAGLRRIIPLTPRTGIQHSLTLGIDYKDFNEDVNIVGADALSTPIRYAPLTLGYNLTMPDANGTTTANVTANFSTLSLSARKTDCQGTVLDQFECKRPGAKPNYLYLRADLQRTQNIVADMTFLARIGVQLTADPLISNEQYVAGGLQSVRGYLESERFGDTGWQASTELRSPSYRRGKPANPSLDVYGLAFVDAARLRLVDPQPGQESDFRLLGAGAGLRLTAGKWLSAEVHWAKALHDGSVTREGDSRVHARIEARF